MNGKNKNKKVRIKTDKMGKKIQEQIQCQIVYNMI
jgi:hypothetical protein